VIRHGSLLTVGDPDELRTRAGSARVEVVGRGFENNVLDLLQARPEVATVEVQNGHLFINLREETDTAPLVSLMVGAGVQIEEVRKDKASLEEVFLTLMQEDK
jgi:ABC-2 type transport system ATP-binding protein